MMKKWKKTITCLVCIGCLLTSIGFTGCSSSKKPIQLTVYSQLANYSGKLTGWFAKLLLEKYNCEMTIIPDTDGSFETRMENGNLGDIIIFGTHRPSDYHRAVSGGYLLDWNEDNLLATEGSYMNENMQAALEKNKQLTAEIYNEYGITKDPSVFGFAMNVATTDKDHKAFLYTWDIRWDLYEQLGCPPVKNLDDYYNMLVAMKEICPTDENGNPAYAFSMWPDWDGHMVMYPKCLVTTYWGLEGDFGVGMFDTITGNYYRPIDEGSHYFDAIRFFNKLYRAGLIDPNSMTQKNQTAGEKMLNGGAFASVFNYAGSLVYNTKEHRAENKYMLSLVPEDATPIAYGMSTAGDGGAWAIGANTEYPELCMEFINWMCTPEGFMTYLYGPEAEYDEATGTYDPECCWYIKDGYSYFTELGENADANRRETQMPERWGGGTFQDGVCEIAANTWSTDASNPLTKGETYNSTNWGSKLSKECCQVEQNWRDLTGCITANEYLGKRNKYIVNHSTASFNYTNLPDELKVIVSQLDSCVTSYSWTAIYANSEEECEKNLQEMKEKYLAYDANDQVYQWYLDEAKKAYEIEVSKSNAE